MALNAVSQHGSNENWRAKNGFAGQTSAAAGGLSSWRSSGVAAARAAAAIARNGTQHLAAA